MRDTQPLVSIIMNCHNSERYLAEAIESVINQKYKNWELIFWDNFSTDRSSKILNSYKDKRIKYFLSEEFTSLGKARNLALKKVSGEFVAFLDCDDLWHPDKLKKQIPFFKDKKVGLVISNTIFFGENYKSKVLYKKSPPQGYIFGELLEAYFISLETAIVRFSSLKRLNEFFDNRFEVIEEFDLFLRISLQYKLAYTNEILGKWRIHQNSLTWKNKELFPLESKLFLDKIKTQYPEAAFKYTKQLYKFKMNIKYQEFLIFWENQKLNEKRKLFNKYIFNSRKLLAVYIISFFITFKLFEFLKNKIMY